MTLTLRSISEEAPQSPNALELAHLLRHAALEALALDALEVQLGV